MTRFERTKVLLTAVVPLEEEAGYQTSIVIEFWVLKTFNIHKPKSTKDSRENETDKKLVRYKLSKRGFRGIGAQQKPEPKQKCTAPKWLQRIRHFCLLNCQKYQENA